MRAATVHAPALIRRVPSPPLPAPRSKLVLNYAQQAEPARAPSKFAKPAPGGSQLAAFRRHSEADAAWEAGWRAYHSEHARLEAICKECAAEVAALGLHYLAGAGGFERSAAMFRR